MGNATEDVIRHTHIGIPYYGAKCLHVLKQVLAHFGEVVWRMEHNEIHAGKSLVGKSASFNLCIGEVELLKLRELAYRCNIIGIHISFDSHCCQTRSATPLVGIHQTSRLGHVGCRTIIVCRQFEYKSLGVVHVCLHRNGLDCAQAIEQYLAYSLCAFGNNRLRTVDCVIDGCTIRG